MTRAISSKDRPMSDSALRAPGGLATSVLMSSMLPSATGVSATGADAGHLVEQGLALLDRVVEVRRDADAAAGPVVDDELAGDELVVHAFGVAGVDRDVATALLRVMRGPDGEPALERAFEQRLGERHRPLADALHP